MSWGRGMASVALAHLVTTGGPTGYGCAWSGASTALLAACRATRLGFWRLRSVIGWGGDDFRLVLWCPPDEEYLFCELELSRVAPTELPLDALVFLAPVSGDRYTSGADGRLSASLTLVGYDVRRRRWPSCSERWSFGSAGPPPGSLASTSRLACSASRVTGAPNRSVSTTAGSRPTLTPRSPGGQSSRRAQLDRHCLIGLPPVR